MEMLETENKDTLLKTSKFGSLIFWAAQLLKFFVNDVKCIIYFQQTPWT